MSMQLHDIFQITETVKIAQGELEIKPVDVEPLAQCIFRSQQVLNLISSGDVDAALLFASAPAFVREMICLSLDGDPSQKADMDAVKRIVAGDQIKLITRIFEISFPDGLTDFFGAPSEPASASTSTDRVAEAVDTDAQSILDDEDPELEAALLA